MSQIPKVRLEKSLTTTKEFLKRAEQHSKVINSGQKQKITAVPKDVQAKLLNDDDYDVKRRESKQISVVDNEFKKK